MGFDFRSGLMGMSFTKMLWFVIIILQELLITTETLHSLVKIGNQGSGRQSQRWTIYLHIGPIRQFLRQTTPLVLSLVRCIRFLFHRSGQMLSSKDLFLIP